MGSTRADTYVQLDEPGLNLGLALPFHMAVNHYGKVASYTSAKRWRLESGSSVLSFFTLSCGYEEGVQHIGAYV